ncbi:glycerol-3-phosphate dehydrogenase/oxidase [Lentibacillus saliphilus]|uniref:glycerol-3-phosphate dehydrogenase/oxidase n=1 Tax=Lentibacillus saliphilus TaxID=2737028 RepID=UPI003CCE9105
MAVFSSSMREEIFEQLSDTRLDVLVIGGGITGAGIALDAITRGLQTGLVEMQDFAAGTSSRSTKLVHGGLRYLKQLEVKMVAEVGKERAIVYENGPHVTTPEWMMLPFYKGGTFSPVSANAGLRLYDVLAGVKRTERRKMLSAKQALQKEPLIKRSDLKGAGYYVEYKTDDARLTIEVIKKAVQMGAKAINYAKVIECVYNENDKIIGAIVEDQMTGATYTVYAKKVINATGPWVDELRDLDGSRNEKSLMLTKGVHLVFSRDHFPLKQAVYFDAPDGRMIFAIPRDQSTYVGTTDTLYKGDKSHPTVTVEDRNYLLDAVNHMFPSLKLTEAHVASSWSGLRPLIAEIGKKPGDISRKDEVFISDTGLISIAGGKLTGYRKMAEDVVDQVVDQLKKEDNILYSESQTIHLPISGGDVGGSQKFEAFMKQKVAVGSDLGIDHPDATRLVQMYGSNVDVVYDIYQSKKNDAAIADLPPLVFAQLVYAIEFEMAYKPADFFVRRTGALYFNIDWVRQYKGAIVTFMAQTLNWSTGQKSAFKNELDQLIDEAVHPVEV